MSEKFEVGEVAIGQGCVVELQCNGMECTIIGDLRYRIFNEPWKGIPAGDTYLVLWADGYRSTAWPWQLRKKGLPPKREDLGSWDLCPWQPKEVRV